MVVAFSRNNRQTPRFATPQVEAKSARRIPRIRRLSMRWREANRSLAGRAKVSDGQFEIPQDEHVPARRILASAAAPPARHPEGIARNALNAARRTPSIGRQIANCGRPTGWRPSGRTARPPVPTKRLSKTRCMHFKSRFWRTEKSRSGRTAPKSTFREAREPFLRAFTHNITRNFLCYAYFQISTAFALENLRNREPFTWNKNFGASKNGPQNRAVRISRAVWLEPHARMHRAP